MKKFIFAILFPIISTAQNDNIDFAISPGVILQKDVYAELNVIVGKVINDPVMCGISGFRIGVESNLRSNSNFTIAPKIGYEVSLVFFSGRISAINYFQNGNSSFRITPEIGFSLASIVNLTYGYGIKFETNNINDLSQHRLSLTVNLSKLLTE